MLSLNSAELSVMDFNKIIVRCNPSV